MSRKITFYYDIVCPYAYIASTQIEAVARRAQATLDWKPVLLGGLYKNTSAPQGKDGSATDVMSMPKRTLLSLDLLRQSTRVDHPVKFNEHHPAKSLKAVRLLHLCSAEERPSLTRDLYRAYWQSGLDIARDDVLAPLASRYKLQLGDTDSQEIKDKLIQTTKAASDLGAFGVPAFHVQRDLNDEGILLWGSDRLHFIDHYLTGQQHLHRLAPTPDGVEREVEFFFDFSSPWTYLGASQIERIARECRGRVKWTPVLLGAIFKAIGTNNTPMTSMAPAKQEYMSKDIAMWCDWWNVPFQFNSHFPIRTVTPLRVALVEQAVIPHLFKAAWVDDVNIAEEAELTRVLTAAGFDAQALIQAAQQADIKNQLKDNTERAVKKGLAGCPSYVVDGGHIIFGQDRINIVADLLCGWKDPIPLNEKSRL